MGWVTLKDGDGVFHQVLIQGDEEGESSFVAEGQRQPIQGIHTATPGSAGAAAGHPKYDYPQNRDEALLANVIYNETASLRADARVAEGQPGSAQDLQNARVAIGEVANRVMSSGHPEWVAPQDLNTDAVEALNGGNADAIMAHNSSLAAARAALSGSNTTSGAEQYRLPLASVQLGAIRGKPLTRHYGPFYDSVRKKNRRIVIAP